MRVSICGSVSVPFDRVNWSFVRSGLPRAMVLIWSVLWESGEDYRPSLHKTTLSFLFCRLLTVCTLPGGLQTPEAKMTRWSSYTWDLLVLVCALPPGQTRVAGQPIWRPPREGCDPRKWYLALGLLRQRCRPGSWCSWWTLARALFLSEDARSFSWEPELDLATQC